MKKVLADLSQQAFISFACRYQLSVGEHEWAQVVSDFHTGQQLLMTSMLVKFDFVQRLPWRLAAMAHHDTAVAKACLDSMLSEFRQQPPDSTFASSGHVAHIEGFVSSVRSICEGGSVK